MKLSPCETITDVNKFLEVTKLRIELNPILNVACVERLGKYNKIKNDVQNSKEA